MELSKVPLIAIVVALTEPPDKLVAVVADGTFPIVAHVAAVELEAVNTCPAVGAVAEDTFTVVVADCKAGASTKVSTGVVVLVATVMSGFAEVTEVTVPVPVRLAQTAAVALVAERTCPEVGAAAPEIETVPEAVCNAVAVPLPPPPELGHAKARAGAIRTKAVNNFFMITSKINRLNR